VSKEFVPKEKSLVVSTSPPKWLNIILDINGILCHCMEKVATNRMPFVNDVRDGIHSLTVPTIIRPKAIFKRPSLLEFFTTISKFANYIFIWNSIKMSIIEEIIDYPFRNLPPPFEILRQDNYRKIETSRGKYLKVIGGSKEIFLKNLSQALFIGSTHLNGENIILINENTKKCVCIDSRNCLLQTWTPLADTDDFLLCTLAPWLLRFYTNCSRRHLKNFVNRYWIGVCLWLDDGPVWVPPTGPGFERSNFCLYFLPDNQNEEFQNFNLLICFKCIFPLYSNIFNPINNPFK
jgi:hypothetical protein